MTSPTIEERFPTAATSAPPTDDQREVVAALRYRVVDLAKLIDAIVPEGRDKSIALTSLEDVLMRANRGVFTGAPSSGVDVSANTVEVPRGGVAKGGVVIETSNAGEPPRKSHARQPRDFDCCANGSCGPVPGPATGGIVMHVKTAPGVDSHAFAVDIARDQARVAR